MLAELNRDEERDGRPYISARLSPEGAQRYPQLLREAMVDGDEDSLQAGLSGPGMLNASETYERDGVVRTRKMNRQAPQTLAEEDLRANIGEAPSLLPDVNSGLSVRRPRQ